MDLSLSCQVWNVWHWQIESCYWTISLGFLFTTPIPECFMSSEKVVSSINQWIWLPYLPSVSWFKNYWCLISIPFLKVGIFTPELSSFLMYHINSDCIFHVVPKHCGKEALDWSILLAIHKIERVTILFHLSCGTLSFGIYERTRGITKSLKEAQKVYIGKCCTSFRKDIDWKINWILFWVEFFKRGFSQSDEDIYTGLLHRK